MLRKSSRAMRWWWAGGLIAIAVQESILFAVAVVEHSIEGRQLAGVFASAASCAAFALLGYQPPKETTDG